MANNLVIMLADGFEEVEFTLPFDLCQRAGIEVLLVAVPSTSEGDSSGKTQLVVTGSHGLQVLADCHLDNFLQDYWLEEVQPKAVFLPGGMPGSLHLAQNADLINFLQEYNKSLAENSRYLAAICAAPAYVLGKASGLLQGKRYTCYPGAEAVVPAELKVQKLAEDLVEDQRIITATGVGSAHLMGYRLMEHLASQEKAAEVMQAVLYSEAVWDFSSDDLLGQEF